jgi:subtilisin family serine protease
MIGRIILKIACLCAAAVLGVFVLSGGLPFRFQETLQAALPVQMAQARLPHDQYIQNGFGIGIEEMWRLFDENQTNEEVVVAVIDTGVDIDHPELADVIWQNSGEVEGDGIDNDGNGYIDDMHGWNFVSENSDADAFLTEGAGNISHGTLCAGIIAAHGEIGKVMGISGKADVKIMSLKVFEYSEDGEIDSGTDVILEAIRYADSMGADICNLSLCYDSPVESIENEMRQSEMLFVASAGNSKTGEPVDSDQTPRYPACYEMDNLISVANLGRDGTLYSGSHYGKTHIDLAAPGENLYSLIADGNYGTATGTSMSTAVVSAVAAVLKAADGELSSAEIKTCILNSVTQNDDLTDKVATGGCLNAAAALKAGLDLR